MIHGTGILLRTVRETDLDRLYVLLTDITNRDDFVPLQIPSTREIRRDMKLYSLLRNEVDTCLPYRLLCK